MEGLPFHVEQDPYLTGRSKSAAVLYVVNLEEQLVWKRVCVLRLS